MVNSTVEQLLTSEKLLDELEAHGADFFCGVPDSIMGRLISLLKERGHVYIPATCEDVAVGIATGAYLAGKHPCVLMQNSGLGNAGDTLVTLAKLYNIPLLLVVTIPDVLAGADETEKANYIQHMDWKRITVPLLDAIECPYVLIDHGNYQAELARAFDTMEKKEHPVAVIIRKGYLDEKK